MVLFGVMTAPFGWVTSSHSDFAMMVLFGALSVLALPCVNGSLKVALASVVAPYQYTKVSWTIMPGCIVFGDVPDRLTLVGAIVIILAGLYIFWRERKT